MSEPATTCEMFSDRLMDFLDGDVDGAARAAMESHARRCATCGALVADLRRVSAQAAELPVLTPSRDLWRGIATRLETPVVALADRRPWWRSPALLSAAVAATFVVAAVLGYATTHRAARGSAAAPPAAPVTAQRAPVPTPADTALGGPAQARLAANRAARATPAAVEQSYDTEIAALHAVLNARRNRLDPTTVAVIEKNLTVIDGAIAQCKTALARDPASRFLLQSLTQS
ncbi:MAG: hypothetical protein B7Z72_11030, partial [Gemmatimonadetes bacterium 21-71-4]